VSLAAEYEREMCTWPHHIFAFLSNIKTFLLLPPDCKVLPPAVSVTTHTHTHIAIQSSLPKIQLLRLHVGHPFQTLNTLSSPLLPTHSRCRGCLFWLDHTQTHTTVGRTPLDKGSARRRDLYLTTHNSHKRRTSMPPVGFDPTIPASAGPQTYALDRAAAGIGQQWTHKSE
jgi:hypothetical protein